MKDLLTKVVSALRISSSLIHERLPPAHTSDILQLSKIVKLKINCSQYFTNHYHSFVLPTISDCMAKT